MKRLFALFIFLLLLPIGSVGAEVAPLKPSEVKEIARVSNIDAVRQLRLKVIDRFKTPQATVTLVSAEGAKPTAPVKTFKLAHRLLEDIADEQPRYSFLFPERTGDLWTTYQIRLSNTKRRYAIFLPWRPTGAPSAFTPVRVEKPFPSVASFFVHVDQSIRFDPRVKGNLYNVFVETCNEIVLVEPTKQTKQQLTILFNKRYPGQSTNPNFARALRLVLIQAGQELTCNSLAAAMSFAWTGIPYKEYKEIMSQARLTALGQALSGYFLVVGPKDYTTFRKSQ